MKLDLESLQKALATLERAIKRCKSNPTDEDIRALVIHWFGISSDICSKMIKRRLEQDMPTPKELAPLSYQNLLREAAERLIIADAGLWMKYREKRGTVVHTYDEEKAREVYEAALEFYIDATDLLKELEKRNQ